MPSQKKKYLIAVIGLLIILIAAFGFYKAETIKAYYTDMQERPFKSGDKVYAIKAYSIIDDTFQYKFYRRIISEQTGERQLFYNGDHILTRSLNKNHSTAIGNFIERQFINVISIDKGKLSKFLAQAYVVEPDKKLLEHEVPKDPIPVGYKFEDDKWYIPNYNTSTKNQYTK